MESPNFFLNEERHLRSGWRLAVFVVAFLACEKVLEFVFFGFFSLVLGQPARATLGFIVGAGVLLGAATLVGWGCGAVLEELPFRALGWTPHRGWLRNLLIGSGVGAGSLVLAAMFAAATRGVAFSFDAIGAAPIGKTLAVTGLVFVIGAAAEEALFRGYVLQTLTRAKLAWLGVLVTSVPFALAHLGNPNVVRGFTFVNTALAGWWLAIAYLRTRSLWFPLGLHWSWNWMQAAIFGLPVSGIDRFAPAPLLHAVNRGPDWLTGGAYGIEGGAACTVALAVSIFVVWRTKLIARADVPTTRERA